MGRNNRIMVFPTEDEQNKLLDMVNLPEERELRVLTHCPIAKTNCKWFVGRGSHWVVNVWLTIVMTIAIYILLMTLMTIGGIPD